MQAQQQELWQAGTPATAVVESTVGTAVGVGTAKALSDTGPGPAVLWQSNNLAASAACTVLFPTSLTPPPFA